ncbi:MAG: glycoside hydrolase family 88 protein [Spirochaetaceae bacterium]|nr:glycoside hydrolase family 88 protein [Spirochaetaceae bacterium]
MIDAKAAREAMDKIIIRMTNPISNLDFAKWEWPQGVGLYGMLKLYRETRDARYRDILDSWFRSRMEEGLPERNVNTTAPMLTLIGLYELEGGEDRLRLCLEWAEWVMREMPRTRDGGLQHIVTGRRNDGQLWVDTLYMTVLFLAKTGLVAGRREYVEESVRQFLTHVKYLADRETGLWFHGWTFEGRHNFGRGHWGRGNCWFAAGVVDFIEMTGVEGGVKAFLVDALRDQVEALAPLQDADGMWRTVLDDATSYKESSATAGFGYGILKGVRLGLLPASFKPMGLRACEAVLSRVDPTGTVLEVSYGTPMGDDAEFYKRIPVAPMAYGQALTVHLLGEALKA